MPIGEKFDVGILDQIKEKHIKPKAKWTFLLRDYVVWGLGFLSLILGAIAFSVIIYVVKNNDWDLYREFSGNIWEFMILTLPYFWIAFLAIFLFVLNYNLKHTKKGYKLSLPIVASVSLLVSMFFGVLFFNIGMGKALDDVLGANLAYYDRIINPMVRMWNQPENGRLTGLVIAQVENGRYRLLDIARNEWLIDVNGAEFPRNFIMEIGRPVKLLGKQEDAYFFVVKRVFYHEGPGRGMMMHRLREGGMPPFMPSGLCMPPDMATGSNPGTCPFERR